MNASCQVPSPSVAAVVLFILDCNAAIERTASNYRAIKSRQILIKLVEATSPWYGKVKMTVVRVSETEKGTDLLPRKCELIV
jgi:hypothetical protein